MNEHEPWPRPGDGHIESWLTGRLGRPYPDRDAVLRRTLERIPAEPQNLRRWRLRPPWSDRDGDQRRASMARPPSSRIRMVSAAPGVLIVLVIASLAAVALQSLASSTGTMVPTASPAGSPGPAAAAYFTGTMRPGIISNGGERTIVGELGPDDGASLRRGLIEMSELHSSDARFAGEISMEWNDERYGSPAEVGTIWGTQRIENDEGAWSGTFVGSGTSETGGVTWHASVMGRYVGEGTFEGLAAIVFFDLYQGSLEGVIVPEALAPPPLAERAASRPSKTTPSTEGVDR